jgi:hypothetical protein
MKKLLTIAFAMLLGATLSFAQTTGGTTATDKTGKPDTKTASTTGTKSGKKATKTAHKGGKKGKKSSGGTSTTPPK